MGAERQPVHQAPPTGSQGVGDRQPGIERLAADPREQPVDRARNCPRDKQHQQQWNEQEGPPVAAHRFGAGGGQAGGGDGQADNQADDQHERVRRQHPARTDPSATAELHLGERRPQGPGEVFAELARKEHAGRDEQRDVGVQATQDTLPERKDDKDAEHRHQRRR